MNYYIFLIDTEHYAGNFERQLTAWCTGVVGECGVGREYAELFYTTYPVDTAIVEDADLTARVGGVFSLPDEHGCHRPTAIFPTPGWSSDGLNYARNETGAYHAYQSVGIFLERMPTPEAIAFLQGRALAYHPLQELLDSPITITGFRLLRHIEEEILVAAYPLPGLTLP